MNSIPGAYDSFWDDLFGNDDCINFGGGVHGENFESFNSAQREATLQAFQHIEELINVEFEEDPNGGTLRLGYMQLDGASGLAYRPDAGGSESGDIWLDSDTKGDLTPGGSGFTTLLHEIGHALGLHHTHDHVTLPESQDSDQYSVMSYELHPNGAGAEPETMQLYDIAALQYLYGANPNASSGDNIYTFEADFSGIKTIWDGGGNDTIDASKMATNSVIRLDEGSFSTISALSERAGSAQLDNVAIAYNTVIENATGGIGDDTIYGNDQANVLDGGSGNDELRGFRGRDSLAGRSGDDKLFGGNDNDTLEGGGDSDTLDGGDGDDSLLGGDDDDTLTGDFGNDFLNGDDGDDDLQGGNDNDTLQGGLGSDTLDGGLHNDVLLGGSDRDILIGGFGNDSLKGNDDGDDLQGGFDNDTLEGGHGSDFLEGGDGDDSLLGGGQRDSLSGGLGNDFLDGGTGTDIVHAEGNVDITLNGSSLTGIGTDTLVSIEEAFLEGGVGDNRLRSLNFSGDVTLKGEEGEDELLAQSGNNRLQGGLGNDTLSDGDGDSRLDGNDDDDTLTGGLGNDEIDGGDGFDRLDESGDFNFTLTNSSLTTTSTDLLTPYADTLTSIEEAVIRGEDGDNSFEAEAFSGEVTLIGGNGNDELIGGSANDYLRGEGDDDTLTGGEGDDRLFGGTGNDLLFEEGDVSFNLTDTYLDGLGDDTVSSIERAELVGGISNNSLLVYNFSGDATLRGQEGDDFLYVESGNNLLDGATGNDSLMSSSQSQDTLLGGDDNDTLMGGALDDVIDGGDGIDLLRESGNFDFTLTDSSLTTDSDDLPAPYVDQLISIEEAELIGGDGNNVLDASGFSGNVTLEGGDGDDTLKGGTGDNVLDGGAGNNDFLLMEGGEFHLSGTSLTSSSGNLTVSGIEHFELVGGNQDDVIQVDAFSGDVTLHGHDGDDLLTVGSGNNVLDGGNGNDRVFGGFEEDSLVGGNHDDTLLGDYGNDTIDGGEGTDRLVEYGSYESRILTDTSLTSVNSTDPHSEVDSLNSIEEVGLYANSGNNLLDAAAFNGKVTLEGGGGDDDLRGGFNDDSLSGGIGNDMLFGGSSGVDRVIEEGNFDFTLTDASLTADSTDLLAPYVDSLSRIDEAALAGGDGNNALIVTDFSGKTTLEGHDGSDDLRGGMNDDVLEGGSGNDSLRGYFEDDTLQGGIGDDYLNGEIGNDELLGGDGRDTLIGGIGNDVMVGGDGNDILTGVQVFTGDHIFNGIDSQDVMTGGAGADRFDLGGPVNMTGDKAVFYVDTDATTSGDHDYALITDFDPLEDTLRLSQTLFNGDLANYLIEGDGLYLDSNGSDTYDLTDDLIATGLTGVDLNASYIEYV
ncbi:MAG: M10 family metallopeptidase [Cyanobacteria bacterium P01_F01_bin.33]